MTNATHTNTPEVHVVFCDRDERKLAGRDRLPTVIAMTQSPEETRRAMFALADLPEETIEDHDLRNPNLDLLELRDLLNGLTDNRLDVCPYELDPRFPGPLRS